MPIWASFALPLVAGLAASAAALPFLIHLLSKQRYQVVPWAAMRFLVGAQKRHRRQIDRWLLLVLRTLLILLILGGMCAATDWAERLWQAIRPGALVATSNAPRTHHILVIDASLSMTAAAERGTRFENAIANAGEFIRNANPGDGFTLIELAGTAQAIIPGPAADPDKVALEVEALKPTHGTCDYSAALPLIAETLARSPKNFPRRQVTIFTDLQRSAWNAVLARSDTPAPDTWQRILPKADVCLVDLAGGDFDNLSVADVVLSDPLAFVDQSVVVLASVQNDGRSDRANIRLELKLGRPGAESSLLTVESRTIEKLEAGQRASVAFVLDGANRFRDPGTHLLQVQIADRDDLPADDSRSLTVDAKESIPCLLVNGKQAMEPYQRASGYLETALEPLKLAGGANPARPRTVSLAEFADASLSDLGGVDCVFLCDVPSPTAAQVARLEAHLKRGGSVVIAFGPNSAANRDKYNELLYDGGNGLLPGKLTGVKASTGPNDAGFVFAADEAAFQLDPLAAFRSDNSRAGLLSVPFTQYVQIDAPADGRSRRILSFVPAKAPEAKPGSAAIKPEPALIEMPRHRGKVIVFASSLNRDWTVWPVLQSYLPMMHELLRYAATTADRHTLRTGETIEEFFPANAVGLTAKLLDPEGQSRDVPIVAGDETGVARSGETRLSGLYRLMLKGQPVRTFAVNVPESNAGGGNESDLHRLDPARLKELDARIRIVDSPDSAQFDASGDSPSIVAPKPWGPAVARWLLTLALVLLAVEIWLAWFVGPSRTAIGTGIEGESAARRSPWRFAWAIFAGIPLAVAALLLFAVIHATWTGHPLGFLPGELRAEVETLLGVPKAGAGESSRWRLESFPLYLRNALHDRWLLGGLVAAAAVCIASFYFGERRTTQRRRRLLLPMALRLAVLFLLGTILLPQLRIAFDRESWPDVAILIDRSASMATVESFRDPAVQAKAKELAGLAGVPEANRLQLAQWLLTDPKGPWLEKLIAKRQVKVHVYAMAEQPRLVSELDESSDLDAATKAIRELAADGEQSKLGDAVLTVLKAFRGGSLSAMIVLTDGVITQGDDWTMAAREAARSSVPLSIVGLGQSYEPPDAILSDLKCEDVVLKGDQWLLEARVTAKGLPTANVPVILWERLGEKLVERNRTTVPLDPTGKPSPVRLEHIPQEIGEKTFVIEVPPQPGETELLNNRIERTILVTQSKRLKVLFVEGQPRYEYRFVKAILEREVEEKKGGRPVELDVLLLDASAGHWQSDKSAERLRGATPTKTQLFEYDAIIFGDVRPDQLPKPAAFFADLVEFVKVKGGGILFLAGEHATPHKLFDTPLAELLPVMPTPGSKGGPAPTPAESPITDTYLPKPTPLGRTHPLFRFVPDQAENARIWEGLKPFYWVSTGWQRKASAESLATHPTRPSEGSTPNENHPLVVQHFVGAGRAVFLAFDETWRWRWRSGEERFNHFWTQAVRATAKSRVVRIDVKTDKQTAYRRNEPIRITVRYPDDAPAPTDASVKVQVQRRPIRLPGRDPLGDTETQSVTLSRVDGTRATYEALLTRTPEGEYTFVLNDGTERKAKPKAEARVMPPPGERDRLDMNRADLVRAATESRGKFYTLADADRLIDDLPEAERVPLNQPCPPLSVWNHASLFGLIVTLLGLEWWVRRRERLV